MNNVNVTKKASLLTVSTAVLLTTFSSGAALAGFEWNPPQIEQPVAPFRVEMPKKEEATPVEPAPNKVIIEKPQIQWHKPAKTVSEPEIKAVVKEAPPSPVVETKKKTLAIVEDEPVKKTVKDVIKEAVDSIKLEETKPVEVSKPIVSMYEFAQGFGKDVPLALALRQIVPADFGYAVQNNANLGLRVDWNGNKPWNEVLNAAIQEYDLEAVVIEKTVLIKKIGAPIEPSKEKVQKSSSSVMIETSKEMQEPEIEEVKSDMMLEDESISEISTKEAISKPMSLIAASQWKAEKGDALYPLIVQWCNAVGVKLLWNSKEEYEVAQDIEVSGNFEDAIQRVLMTFKGQSKRPVGMFKANDPKGKAVLSISDSSGI